MPYLPPVSIPQWRDLRDLVAAGGVIVRARGCNWSAPDGSHPRTFRGKTLDRLKQHGLLAVTMVESYGLVTRYEATPAGRRAAAERPVNASGRACSTCRFWLDAPKEARPGWRWCARAGALGEAAEDSSAVAYGVGLATSPDHSCAQWKRPATAARPLARQAPPPTTTR